MSEKRNISNKLFAELCSHFSNEINSPFEIRTFKKGGFIYRKGNQPKGVYFIKYGWVKIFRGGNEGDEVILRMLGHNEFIGYVSLLKDTPYPDNAQALGYCELYFFPEMYSSHLYMRTMILPGQLFKCCVMRYGAVKNKL